MTDVVSKKSITFEQLAERFKDIKLLALDVDGVLTNDYIYFGPADFEMKKFNVSDGFYIVLAMRAGLEIAVVSGRPSAATTTRSTRIRTSVPIPVSDGPWPTDYFYAACCVD